MSIKMSMDMDHKTVEEMAPGIALDDFLPYLLNRIANRLNQGLADDLKVIGHSLQTYRILAILTARDGRSINELAVYSVTEQPTLSKIVERLEVSGLIERRQSHTDGRIVNVYLTQVGKAAYSKILPLALKHYRLAIEGVNGQEQESLNRSLHKVLDNIRRSPFP
jgi:DNA-binding MarR family transcriptional regulator